MSRNPQPGTVPKLVAAGATLALLLALATPSAALADVDGDIRGGVYTDASETFLGGGLLMPVGGHWMFNPNVEWVFVDKGDLATFNADFHYDFASEGQTDFWVGGGPAAIFRENRFGNDETDLGLNLLGGIGFLRNSAVRPYLQAKVIISDETEGVVAVGIRFG